MVPPFVVRELRLGLRKRGVHRARLSVAAGACGIAVLCLLTSLAGLRAWGRSLHHWLLFLALFYGVLRPAQVALGLFTDEARAQNLGLLAITGIRPLDIFLGKMAGGLIVASTELLALVPFLAMPFLSGGIPLNLYLATVAALPIFLLFGVAVGMLASVICDTDSSAGVLAFWITAAISLATPLPYWLGLTLAGKPPFSDLWLSASPAYAGWLLFTQFTSGGAGRFWMAAGITLFWTAVCILAAHYCLKTKWRRLSEQDLAAGGRWWERLMAGSIQWRNRLRPVLEQNPFQWLAQRDRRPVTLAWLGVAAICAIWLLGWSTWPRYWPSPVNFFITAMLLVMLVDVFQLHAAARTLAQTRQSGSLELLLTTLLKPQQVLEGQITALKKHFRPLRWCLLGLFALMIFGGFLTRKWTGPALGSFLGIWGIFILWCLRSHRRTAPTAMWVALNTGRTSYAVYRSQGSPWQWLWLFFNLRHLRSFASAAGRFPTGSDGEVILVSLILMIMLLVFAFGKQKQAKIASQFVEDFRRIAQRPIPDRDDPAFKQWKDVSQPFPNS